MEQIYETLRELPLLKGASLQRIMELVSKIKFHFLKYPDETVIMEPFEEYSNLRFVISGAVRMTVSDPAGRLKVSMTIQAPDVLVPQFFFGKRTTSPCKVVALDTIGILEITKSEFLRILKTDNVFLYNYLNYLSMSAQKGVDGVLSITSGSLEERLAYWVIMLTSPNAKDIVIETRLRDMYAIFGVQRSAFIAMLERMKAQGLVDYTKDTISFTSRSALLELLSHEE